VYFGGREVIAGTLTAGAFTAFLVYTFMVGVAIAALASLWGSLNNAAGATRRLFEIIDTQPTITEPANALPLPAGGGSIRFDDVSFAYPTRPEEPVVKHIELSVNAGEMVALVGRSGAGKSTLTALVQRFYDVTEGRVLVEGVDVRELGLASLRSVIAIVAQEPVLFSGTVRENIAYGREGASLADVVAAAKQAHAHAFIEGLADGYESKVGERGVKLSGGQRQRIAIARAILRDPRILILDEATSNLDSESEALVQEALGRLMHGRTTLVVAHRLSTVRDATRIVVLDRGRIVEQGPHDVLMGTQGLYRTLVEHQLIFAEGNSSSPPRPAVDVV
jgi:ABC-type multidrug transport system fused ATPase/permease subunit